MTKSRECPLLGMEFCHKSEPLQENSCKSIGSRGLRRRRLIRGLVELEERSLGIATGILIYTCTP